MRILKSQRFSDTELIAYAASLSQRAGGPREKLLHWDFGPLMDMRHDPEAKNYLFSDERVPFHWDGAFFQEPRFLLFYCTESAGAGGETLFTNTQKVWDRLSHAEKTLCGRVKLTYRTKKLAHYGGEITVPLVQRHPETGAVILRLAEKVESALNPVGLVIQGVDDPEAFYDHMVAKLYQEECLYEHRWETGDVLLCDNHTYLHGRRPLGSNRGRSFKRLQIL